MWHRNAVYLKVISILEEEIVLRTLFLPFRKLWFLIHCNIKIRSSILEERICVRTFIITDVCFLISAEERQSQSAQMKQFSVKTVTPSIYSHWHPSYYEFFSQCTFGFFSSVITQVLLKTCFSSTKILFVEDILTYWNDYFWLTQEINYEV